MKSLENIIIWKWLSATCVSQNFMNEIQLYTNTVKVKHIYVGVFITAIAFKLRV